MRGETMYGKTGSHHERIIGFRNQKELDSIQM